MICNGGRWWRPLSRGGAAPAPLMQGSRGKRRVKSEKVKREERLGTGGYGLPQPVTSVTGFAMTCFLQEVRYRPGTGGQGCPPLRVHNKGCERRPLSHGFAVTAPLTQGSLLGCGLPRALCALAMTGCVGVFLNDNLRVSVDLWGGGSYN